MYDHPAQVSQLDWSVCSGQVSPGRAKLSVAEDEISSGNDEKNKGGGESELRIEKPWMTVKSATCYRSISDLFTSRQPLQWDGSEPRLIIMYYDPAGKALRVRFLKSYFSPRHASSTRGFSDIGISFQQKSSNRNG